MTNRLTEPAQELRRRAEALILENEAALPEEARQTLHELRVHQIELEMQNAELRRLQKDLDISKHRYFFLYDLAPVGYLTISEQGVVKEANLAAATILGAVQDALLNKPITQFILREDQTVYYLHRKKVLEVNIMQKLDMRLVRSGGEWFWAHLHVTPVYNGEYMVTFTDITERKQTEAALKEMANSLSEQFIKVQQANDLLEQKVEERTEELEESNRRLEILCITDGLTAIANRRRFDEVLVQEHARHTRSGAELSLILLDIDHFKAFNDSYGHVAGDDCLRKVGQVIAECTTRAADLASRYGGEEFACILPETDIHGAVAIAEKIRMAILALAIPHIGSNVTDCVTASLGVVTVRCVENKSVVDIVAHVDDLLYRAKSCGRNRVEFDATDDAALPSLEGIKANFVQLVWQDNFCSGNQLIDSQHQSLFQLSNKLLEIVLSDRPSAEISATITRLLDDASQHFHDEEVILKAAGFPDLSQHTEEHAKLLKKGLKLSQEFAAATLFVGNVFQFLVCEVVMRHMLEADRLFFPCINNVATSGSGAKSVPEERA